MPTGYTAAIADGITFQQYALACARAFGALITMRDQPSDAPIPDRFEPDVYYQKSLEAVQKELDTALAFSAEQVVLEAEKSYLEQHSSWTQRRVDRADRRAKYESMLVSVRAYVAPTPDHVEYKAFMERQIVDSIEWDCDDKCDEEPQRVAAAEWIAGRLADLRRAVANCEQRARDEVAHAHQRTEWVRALRKSLDSHA